MDVQQRKQGSKVQIIDIFSLQGVSLSVSALFQISLSPANKIS